MLNKLRAPLLLSTALIITACGGENNNSDSIQGIDQDGNPFRVDGDLPEINISTWEEEFKKHRERVRKIRKDPLGNYRITNKNELLVITPHPLIHDYNQASDQPVEIKSGEFINFLKLELFFHNTPYELLLLNGKLFMNQRRVYDVDLLLKCSDPFSKLDDSSIKELISKSVESNKEDKALINYYKNHGETPKLSIIERLSNPLSAISDLSQRQSFKDVRKASDATGQLRIDGQVSELPLPLFASFDSTLSDPNSKLSSLALKLGSHYVGTVVAGTFETTPLTPNHFESSAVYGFTFKTGFFEAQMGSFFDESNTIQSIRGQRYQLTLGLDTDYVTPFFRILNRTSANDSLSLLGAGLESNLAKYNLGDAMLDATISTSYLTNFDGTAIGYASCRLYSTFSDSTVLSISTDYDTLKGLGLSINASVER